MYHSSSSIKFRSNFTKTSSINRFPTLNSNRGNNNQRLNGHNNQHRSIHSRNRNSHLSCNKMLLISVQFLVSRNQLLLPQIIATPFYSIVVHKPLYQQILLLVSHHNPQCKFLWRKVLLYLHGNPICKRPKASKLQIMRPNIMIWIPLSRLFRVFRSWIQMCLSLGHHHYLLHPLYPKLHYLSLKLNQCPNQ